MSILASMGEDTSDCQESKRGRKRGKAPEPPPDDTIVLSASDIEPLMICYICGGALRDCRTFTECQHSFCSTCLQKKWDEGARKCPHPRCDNLWPGVVWTAGSVKDTQKQKIVDVLYSSACCASPLVRPILDGDMPPSPTDLLHTGRGGGGVSSRTRTRGHKKKGGAVGEEAAVGTKRKRDTT